MGQFLAQHSPPLALAPSQLLSLPEAAPAAASKQPALPARAGGAGNGLPDFLAAALSAASRSCGAQPSQPAAPSGDAAAGAPSGDSGGFGAGNGAPAGGLPDLLGPLLAAARSRQQGGGAAGSGQNGSGEAGGTRGGGNSSGMAGLLSAALAGGLQEVLSNGGACGASSGGPRGAACGSARSGTPGADSTEEPTEANA